MFVYYFIIKTVQEYIKIKITQTEEKIFSQCNTHKYSIE